MDFPKQITVVVCGGNQEYVDYCRMHSTKPDDIFIRRATDAKKLEGLKNCKVVYYGNYWNNKLLGHSILDDIQRS